MSVQHLHLWAFSGHSQVGGCVNPSFAGRANHILWQWGWLCLGYPFLTEWTHTVYLKAEGGGRSITRHMHHAVAPP